MKKNSISLMCRCAIFPVFLWITMFPFSFQFLYSQTYLSSPTKGEGVFISKANCWLRPPANWVRKDWNSRNHSLPANVCLPKLSGPEGFIDAVIWNGGDEDLNVYLDRYVQRLKRTNTEDEKIVEIKRESFESQSGIKGIWTVFEKQTQSNCGLRILRLNRYVFRNSDGTVVCLGCYGYTTNTDGAVREIVIKTLRNVKKKECLKIKNRRLVYDLVATK